MAATSGSYGSDTSGRAADSIEMGYLLLQFEGRKHSMRASPASSCPIVDEELQSVRATWHIRQRFHAMACIVLFTFIDDTSWIQSEDTVFRHEVSS